MVGNCTAMKAKNARNPAKVCGGNDHAPKVTSPPISHQLYNMPESKPGLYLMTIGVTVITISIIYTALVWYPDYDSPHSESSRILGVIQMTAGLTLLFIGLFVYIYYWGVDRSGKNQPVLVQVSTPKPANLPCKTRKARQGSESQPDSSDAALPPYDVVCCADNAAFAAEETDYRRSSPLKTEDKKGSNDETRSTCSHPPAYEDVDPSFDKCNPA